MPVLVVEDDPELRDLLQWALQDAGIPVEAVADGRQAVKWLELRRPSLVLLDLGLPFINGLGVAKRLRDLYGKQVPVLVVSADWKAEETAAAAGLDACFSKPFDIIRLIQTVTNYLPPCPV